MPNFKHKNDLIYYREQGKGDPLLILPGNTASSICHEGELGYFSDRYHTISMDFLGTGKSTRVSNWANDWWLQGAEQAKGLIEHLGYQKCIVMGTSGGAITALLMAIHFPEFVRAVIADSCVEFLSDQFAKDHIIQSRKKKTTNQIRFWEFAHGADWEQVVDADSAMLMCFANAGGDWFSGRLNEIACPVLLTCSKEDVDLERVVEQNCAMAEQIPDCQLFTNNRGRHPLMWTSSSDFRAVSDHFLNSLNGHPDDLTK